MLGVSKCLTRAVRRLLTFDNLCLRWSESFQFSKKVGNLLVSLDPAELLLRHQQSGSHPAFALVAVMPAFHVSADSFDDRECGFDDVGAGQGLPELWRNAE